MADNEDLHLDLDLDRDQDFHDFFPLMAQKLGDHGFMQELAKGFQLLADPSTNTITLHSLRRSASYLGLPSFSDQELLQMFQLGDSAGCGELNLHQFCVAMVRSSPDLMEEALKLVFEDAFGGRKAEGRTFTASDATDDSFVSEAIEGEDPNLTGSDAMEAEKRTQVTGSDGVGAEKRVNLAGSDATETEELRSHSKSDSMEAEGRNAFSEEGFTPRIEEDAGLGEDRQQTLRQGSTRLCANPRKWKSTDACVFPGEREASANPNKRNFQDDAFPEDYQASLSENPRKIKLTHYVFPEDYQSLGVVNPSKRKQLRDTFPDKDLKVSLSKISVEKNEADAFSEEEIPERGYQFSMYDNHNKRKPAVDFAFPEKKHELGQAFPGANPTTAKQQDDLYPEQKDQASWSTNSSICFK